MLLFRSEVHIERWSETWRQPRGSLLSIEQVWGLAQAWYADDRRRPGWRRKTMAEAQEIFTSLGLTSPFWQL